MHANHTADQSWLTSNQPGLQNKQRYNQGPNITVEPIRQTAFKQAQFRTPHFQQAQNFQNPANGDGQPVAQSTHLENQSPYINDFQNARTQAEQLCLKTNLLIIELFKQQEAI